MYIFCIDFISIQLRIEFNNKIYCLILNASSYYLKIKSLKVRCLKSAILWFCTEMRSVMLEEGLVFWPHYYKSIGSIFLPPSTAPQSALTISPGGHQLHVWPGESDELIDSCCQPRKIYFFRQILNSKNEHFLTLSARGLKK
jgi:hypothetical protein